MRLYIAGPISGGPQDLTLEEKRNRFYEARTALNNAGYGAVVPLDVVTDQCSGNCNPHGHIGQDGVPTHSWECFMRHDIRSLLDCDGIATLEGWDQSRGAKVEVGLATGLGMPVYPVADWTARA